MPSSPSHRAGAWLRSEGVLSYIKCALIPFVLFHLQRALSAVWSAGNVPSADVVEGMLRGARNVNDYALATQVLYELRQKIKKEQPYTEFIGQLQPVLNELGTSSTAGRCLPPLTGPSVDNGRLVFVFLTCQESRRTRSSMEPSTRTGTTLDPVRASPSPRRTKW